MSLALCGPVVISEVMVDPEGTDSPNEFVEVVNCGDTAVDLTGWRIGDLNSTDELSSGELILSPGEYALIFEGDYSPESGAYAGLIRPGTHILFVDDNSIGNGLSNSADSLFLMDSTGAVVDRMGWDETPVTGYTLEKVQLGDCTNPGNWRPSLKLQGTPGTINSVAGQVVDLALDSLDWTFAPVAEQFQFTAFVSNPGLVASNGRLMAAGDEVAGIASLSPGEGTTANFSWTPPLAYGHLDLPVRIEAAGDYAAANDSQLARLLVPAVPLAVVINEIMFAPPGGGPEWVELLVTTQRPVNPENWTLADSTGGTFLPAGEWAPGDLVVVTGDSSLATILPADAVMAAVTGFPTLNNSGDIVVLGDPSGVILDQVTYGPLDQFSAGRSLERVSPQAPSNDPRSWRSSPDAGGHTAGRPNAATATPEDAGLTIEPNPLRLNRPESRLVITYSTPFAALNLQATIYDLAGRRIATIHNGGPLPGTGQVSWDARDLDPVRFKTGQYLLVFRAVDTGSTQHWERVERLILVK